MVAIGAFLNQLGWNTFFHTSFESLGLTDALPARVIGQGKGHYHLRDLEGRTFGAAITTAFHNVCKHPADFPVVGDWVAFTPFLPQASIVQVLPRINAVQRLRAGTQGNVQMIASNIDNILIATSMDADFDLARLGRYIAIANESKSQCALVLTKKDLCPNPEVYLNKVHESFPGLPTFAISQKQKSSMDGLVEYFKEGLTTLLLGSSGVGKSTLTNFLLGTELQETGAVSRNMRGKHTTTARHLRITRFGGVVIDTPGMQEIAATDQGEQLKNNFDDIEELALQCKFRDCRHQKEPGCMITKSLKDGTLSTDRWNEFTQAEVKVVKKTKKNKY